MMLSRREILKLAGSAAVAALIPAPLLRAAVPEIRPFRFCLNTSTISGQKPGLLHSIEIASNAGYDGMELWINDIRDYLKQGKTIESLSAFIKKRGIRVENAISFTSWMVDDATKRNNALAELEEEMKMMAALDCRRIAAPPAGVNKNEPVNFQTAGDRYKKILELGRKYGVMPQLEFWGASGTLYNLSQALAIAAAANDEGARILPDVYHLFRGGSGLNGLKLVSGNVIEIIHMNDYPAHKPVETQTDGDRVYPGDGAAPIKQILADLYAMGGSKVLSLELFNKAYWKEDAMAVATTGLQKMKQLVNEVLTGN
jgi:2-keto-myo-inositol isomerase